MASAGRGHGDCGERRHGERLDDGIGHGGAANGEQSRWGGQAGGVDAPLVALHKIAAAPDACGLHLQRVWAAYHQGHQSSCLHRWNCVCSGMNCVICVTNVLIRVQVDLILVLALLSAFDAFVVVGSVYNFLTCGMLLVRYTRFR